jgi:membrane-associated HD superfamily phosphohydrolase
MTRRKLFYALAIGMTILLAITLWFPLYGITMQGIQSLCPAYITISTAILAVIFAVVAIITSRSNIQERIQIFRWPIAFSTISLFGSIYTYYLSYVNNLGYVILPLFFIASVFTFYAVFSITMIILTQMENTASRGEVRADP